MNQNGRKLLVIDDDPEIISVIRLMLKLQGIEVIGATRGPEGIEMARDENPDIILLDIMMPGMDGYEVCEKLYEHPDTKDIPVLFVTARCREEYVERGLSMGARAYVKKPFDPNELMQLIEEHT